MNDFIEMLVAWGYVALMVGIFLAFVILVVAATLPPRSKE